MSVLDARILSNLWFFKSAAETESFSRAASVLNITQGAVSQRIRSLETRLGLVLFERVGKGVVLTATGKQLLEAVRCLDVLDTELAAIASQRDPEEIIVSCIPSLAMDWLIPRLDRWYANPSAGRLRLRAELTTITRVLLAQEHIDLAIVYEEHVPTDLYVRDLSSETTFPVASPGYLSGAPGDTLDFLKQANLLHDERPWGGAEASDEWKNWLQCARLDSQIDHRKGDFFNLTHLATRAALQGQGVAMGRTLLIREHIASGALEQIDGPVVSSPARYRVTALSKPAQGSQVHEFVEWLLVEMAGQVAWHG